MKEVKKEFAHENLRRFRPSLCMAKKMGSVLGVIGGRHECR